MSEGGGEPRVAWFLIRTVLKSTRVVASLIASYVNACIGRRMAVRCFVRALVRAGVPRQAAEEMAHSYPQLPDVRAILRALDR